MTAAPTSRASLSHIERTAEEPRDLSLHRVILSRIDQINDTIRLLKLQSAAEEPAIKFLPGQWLDVHIPNLPKPGGFTITSPPSKLLPQANATSSLEELSPGYVELAIQASPDNPAAAFLWRPASEILNTPLLIRVGGSFVWPPQKFHGGEEGVKKVVMVAGGVGINPLMSMLSTIVETPDKERTFEVTFFYSVKESDPPRRAEEILFLERLCGFNGVLGRGWLRLHLTGPNKGSSENENHLIVHGEDLKVTRGRITIDEVVRALGPVNERKSTVCYICGVPTMTDHLVEEVQQAEGMDSKHVLFERWW